MPFQVTDLGAVYAHGFDTLIDVRSPAEFAEDHVPGAVNLPVFSNAERAEVGTVYVQDSPFRARKIGAAILARNAARHIEGPLAEKDGGWRPLVYCWRGGQRSGAFATILGQIGWRAETIKGGYQAYRRAVVDLLYEKPVPAPIILLDGYTGTAKTDVLLRLKAEGHQVIDLEGLANHRGSVLGGLGEQPAQKMFESLLAHEVHGLDPKRPVLIEAESSKIGNLNLPPRLFEAMKAAPRIRIDAPLAARAAYLARAYRDVTVDVPELSDRLQRLVPIQGHDRVNAWCAMAEDAAFEDLAAELMHHHYDARYDKSRAKADGATKVRIEADDLGEAALDDVARRVARAAAGLAP